MFDRIDLHILREREDEAATRGFYGGLLLGMLLGVVLTLVFAPRRGEETRAAVASVAHDLKARADDLTGRGDQDEASTLHGDVAIEREIVVG